MAVDSKQQHGAWRVYNTLQSLGCPLVDGLYLRETDSVKDLLCTPSLHRMDILKWICSKICPSLKEKFSAIKSAQTEELVKEITQFGHEMLLCKAEDQELIKGLATPSRQLLFLEQLLLIAHDSNNTSEEKSADESMRNEDLLSELMSPDHLPDLVQLMNPVCNPWSSHIWGQLRATHLAQAKANQKKAKDTNNSRHLKIAQLAGDDLADATALLQSTQTTLKDLRKECEFLQSDPTSPGATLSHCALKVAISDMTQLMTAFSQVYDTDFKSYCQRAPPVINPNTHIFQAVHQLLRKCNMELEALQQLSETSSVLAETVTQIQTDKQYWSKGEKHTLPNKLEALKNRYTAFLTSHQS